MEAGQGPPPPPLFPSSPSSSPPSDLPATSTSPPAAPLALPSPPPPSSSPPPIVLCSLLHILLPVLHPLLTFCPPPSDSSPHCHRTQAKVIQALSSAQDVPLGSGRIAADPPFAVCRRQPVISKPGGGGGGGGATHVARGFDVFADSTAHGLIGTCSVGSWWSRSLPITSRPALTLPPLPSPRPPLLLSGQLLPPSSALSSSICSTGGYKRRKSEVFQEGAAVTESVCPDVAFSLRLSSIDFIGQVAQAMSRFFSFNSVTALSSSVGAPRLYLYDFQRALLAE